MRILYLSILLAFSLSSCKTLPSTYVQTAELSYERYTGASDTERDKKKIPGKYLIYTDVSELRFLLRYPRGSFCEFQFDKDKVFGLEFFDAVQKIAAQTFENVDVRLGAPKTIKLEEGYDEVLSVLPILAGGTIASSLSLSSFFGDAKARRYTVDVIFRLRIMQSGGYGGNRVDFIEKSDVTDIKAGVDDSDKKCPEMGRRTSEIISKTYHAALGDLEQTLRRIIQQSEKS